MISMRKGIARRRYSVDGYSGDRRGVDCLLGFGNDRRK
jgi:hypothetical protein